MFKRDFKLCWYPCSMCVHSYLQKYLKTSEFAKLKRFSLVLWMQLLLFITHLPLMSSTNHKKQDWTTVAAFCFVLRLAEMELIFLTVALTVLSFALVSRKVLIHQCFGYIWIALAQSQGCLSRLPPPLPTRGWPRSWMGVTQKMSSQINQEIFHTSATEPKRWKRKAAMH